MWATISIYVALLLIAVVLYYLTRNTAKSGGTQNFWDWLKMGAKAGGGPRSGSGKSVSPGHSADDVDAVAVLEDIYREFREETQKLRNEFEQAIEDIHTEHRQALLRLQRDIEELRRDRGHVNAAMAPEQSTPSPVEDVAGETAGAKSVPNRSQLYVDHSSEATYFRILDELQQGKAPLEIASQLGVSLDEIHRVIQFMSQP